MKRIIISGLVAALALSLYTPASFAKKVTYIATNQRFNYVRLEEVSMKTAEKRAMTHPTEISSDKLRSALSAIRLSKTSFIGDKKADSRNVFEEQALNYLVPHLLKAFAQAKPNEQVVFSYLNKDPILIFRNDRLTVATAWLQGDTLNLNFNKLYAKVQGDTDARGNERRAQNRSRSYGVSLELAPGQSYAANDAETLMIDLNADYATLTKAEDNPPVATTPAEPTKKDKQQAKASPTTSSVVVEQRSPQERLKSLEQLKKEKLITEEEYQQKRKAILDQL